MHYFKLHKIYLFINSYLPTFLKKYLSIAICILFVFPSCSEPKEEKKSFSFDYYDSY